MQHALSYSTSSTSSSSLSSSYNNVMIRSGSGGGEGGDEIMRRLAAENPVLVVGRPGCCMAHVVKRLLLGLGVNPAVCELEESSEEVAETPAVFIGGRLIGGLDRLMAIHISGDLVPTLKGAGALWL